MVKAARWCRKALASRHCAAGVMGKGWPGEAAAFCNSLQRVFLKCYCSLGLPSPKKEKKKGGKKATRKSNLSVQDESGLS